MRNLLFIIFLIVCIPYGWSTPQKSNSVELCESDQEPNNSSFNINSIAFQAPDRKHDKSYKTKNRVDLLLIHPQGITDTIISDDTQLMINKYSLCKRGNLMVYHPYWAKKQNNYNFSLISTFSYYGYSLDGRTGGYKTLNGWDKAPEVTKALAEGCQVELCIFHSRNNHKDDNLNYFLSHSSVQHKFSQDICNQVISRKATGVNIIFDEINASNRANFMLFIQTLSSYLKTNNLNLTVTISTWCDLQSFDLKGLDLFVNKFVIDFSKKQIIGPFASVGNISSAIDWILNAGISSTKIIATLPLYGGLWHPETKQFHSYVPYAEIERNYLSQYDSTHINNDACLALVIENSDTLKLWYDDVQTIAAKSDLIYSKQLGGIGLWTLEYDNDRFELWNTVVNRTLSVDTIQTIQKMYQVKGSELFWAQLKKELQLYHTLFERPCEFGEKEREMMVSDNIIGNITIIVLSILLVVGLLYVYMYKSQGSNWKHQKLLLGALIFLVILSLIVIFLFFFLSLSFTYFGINDSSDSCGTSFSTILKILGLGFIIGLLTMKFLILPLTTRKEIP